MDLLIDETFVGKRRGEWDNLFARLSTYSNTSDISISEIEKVYGKKQNAHFISVKHGFRKRLVNRKRQTRQRQLAFEVRSSDDDELLSDDSSIYSENGELESDISDSDSVDSVQYVLQCNEQRKLPDFNAKVENCQTYLLQNGCFNHTSVKENSASVYINNSSVQKKSLDTETSKVSDICEDTLLSFLEPNFTCDIPIKSTLENKEIDDDRIINRFEDEVKLTIDKTQISNSENKQLKCILQTNISENSLKIHKKLTVSSASDSEMDIQKNDVSNSSIQSNDKETDNVQNQNSNLSTLQSTKTLAINNKTDLNNQVHLNQSKLLNIESVNNLVKISTITINDKLKIYSSAAKKRKLRDGNCSPAKQMEKKHKTIINNSNRNSTKQVTLNGMLEKLKMEQKSDLKTIENNIEHEKKSSINTTVNENVRQHTSNVLKQQLLFNEVSTNNSQVVSSMNNDCSQSIKDEQCHLSRKKNVDKRGRRRKCRKAFGFVQYSTEDTDDTDKSLSISTKTNLTRLSLEYFLDDDLKTIENNIEHEKESSIITTVNENVRQHTSNVLKQQLLFNEISTNNSQLVSSMNNDCSQSIKDEQCHLSGKKNVEKRGRRRKCRKAFGFVQYSTEDTDDTDKSLSISTKRNLTRLSLEYFLDDDIN